MWNRNNLSANIIVESINTVSINKTIPNPETSLNRLIHLTKHIKSVLNAILGYLVLVFGGRCDGLVVKLEDKVAFLCGDTAELSVLGPVDSLRLDFNTTNKFL